MAEKRYIIEPGYIISKFDGDEHFISASQLMDLYGVNPQECVTLPHPKDFKNEIQEKELGNPGFPGTDYEIAKVNVLAGFDVDSMIYLRPLYEGHYREHLEELYKKTEQEK